MPGVVLPKPSVCGESAAEQKKYVYGEGEVGDPLVPEKSAVFLKLRKKKI